MNDLKKCQNHFEKKKKMFMSHKATLFFWRLHFLKQNTDNIKFKHENAAVSKLKLFTIFLIHREKSYNFLSIRLLVWSLKQGRIPYFTSCCTQKYPRLPSKHLLVSLLFGFFKIYNKITIIGKAASFCANAERTKE